jgi:uncharacterized protein YbaR (Trm112 family)
MLDKEILDLIVCPKCHGELELVDNNLICHNDKLAYPIQDGIVMLLVEEAQNLE